MSATDYRELHKIPEGYAGVRLDRVLNAHDFIGRWEMRYSGPAVLAGIASPDKVQWIYDFAEDGIFSIGNEQFVWRLKQEDGASFLVFAPGGPDGHLYGERKIAFKMDDGRLILFNDDTSLVEILTKTTAKPRTKKRRGQTPARALQ